MVPSKTGELVVHVHKIMSGVYLLGSTEILGSTEAHESVLPPSVV